MALAQKRRGYIYILSSPNCPSIKIGKTETLPPHRLRQINAQSPYREHGPWRIVDVVQVEDVTAVETRIHRSISSRRNTKIAGQKELFDIALADARHLLRTVPRSEELYAYPKLERCFFNVQLVEYLSAIYQTVGLSNFLDDQGAWVLSLFTSTAGGRYFTLSIGPHEVAYSSTPKRGATDHWNFLMVDRLILDFPEVGAWVRARGGGIEEPWYETKRDRATVIRFRGTLTEGRELLTLPGVRRSLIAYWTEGLLEMREAGKDSPYKNSHQWNAVAELQRRADGLDVGVVSLMASD